MRTRSAGYLVVGVLLAFAGAFVLADSTDDGGGRVFGIVLVAVGGVLAQIGIIATGVRLGMADHAEPLSAAEPAPRPWERTQ